MFTDHMLFSGATEMIWVLVLLDSFAVSCRIQCLNQILPHPTPRSRVLLDRLRNLFTPRNCGMRRSNNSRRDAPVARKYHDFFHTRASRTRKREGEPIMLKIVHFVKISAAILLSAIATNGEASSFRVQCPAGTTLHPANVPLALQAQYGTVTIPGRTDGLLNPTPAMANPGIKCQQISGGDGFSTMADGTQIYMFSFGPLSGLADIQNGLPGTQPASVFNQSNLDPSGNVLDVIKIGAPYAGYTFNGAIGLVPDPNAGGALTGYVDPRLIMDVGVMNGNIPAPMMAIDEGDEFFLTLTNVGMIMRPDLFEQHTVHFHGYPNASAFYDGVPDASVAINIGGSFTYYYLAPEAGTYFYHCHISPPEHLQMGMVGQIYVRPKQNSVKRKSARCTAGREPDISHKRHRRQLQ